MPAVESFVEQIAAQIAVAEDGQRFTPHGGGTKPGLAAAEDQGAMRVDLSDHAGVLAYEASEFLITARAGTSIAQLQAALAERGQYLPCDPLFIKSGATLGGTVASGISGSSRLLYGSLRDFVMEVEFIDGLGQFTRGGGKVVKNTAGFDLPKLMVGSYGRLGILTELTLKVYPRPAGTTTLRFDLLTPELALAALQRLASQPLPLAALDLQRSDHKSSGPSSLAAGWQLSVRFAGPVESLAGVAKRAQSVVGSSAALVLGPELFDPDDGGGGVEAAWWREQAGFVEARSESFFLVRVAIGPNDFLRFEKLREQRCSLLTARYTGACSIAWLRGRTRAEWQTLREMLVELQLAGVLIAVAGMALGSVEAVQADSMPTNSVLSAWAIGDDQWRQFANRIQRAIDPRHRFCPF